MSGRLFDTVLIVDWSAAASPKRGADSIWWALHRAEGGLQATGNPATRAEAVEILAHLAASEADLGARVLIGFDFPFGYPHGFAEAVTGEPSALALWAWLAEAVEDAPDNANNRFDVAARLNALTPGAGPFWGCPPAAEGPHLAQRKTGIVYDRPAERRIVEHRAASAQPAWKLYTTGSVGGQVLVGLPALERLRHDPRLAGRIAVWPFETGLGAPSGPAVVLAEIYPSLFDRAMKAAREPSEPKDRAQVRVTAAALAGLDAAGLLGDMLAGAPGLSAEEARIVAAEEAWILGVGHEAALEARP